MSIIKVAMKYLEMYGLGEVLNKTACYLENAVLNKLTLFLVKHSGYSFGLNQIPRKQKVIISLTSYPLRFCQLGLCLKSLLLQKVKPDRIIVYLGSDTTDGDITDEMRFLEQYGIEYHIDSEKNLRSHKKYYYSLQEFPKAIVVTADDDILYPRNWLKKLLEAHSKHPKAVCAWRVHKMEFCESGELMTYSDWRWQYRKSTKPRKDLVCTGGAGALYPPGALISESFNTDMIDRLCPNADDLWLKCMETMSGIKVVWVKNKQVMPPCTERQQETALNVVNVNGGMNDKQLKAVMEYYGLESADFKEGNDDGK